MDQEVAVIGQNPVSLVVTFHTDRQFAGLLLQLHGDFIADGLDLALVGAGADDKEIREGGYAGEVQYFDLGGFLSFGGSNRQ